MKNVFLSYSRKDLGFVEKLANDLQQAGYDVWYDLTDLEGGDRWADEIEAAIDNCDAFITVISPNSMASDWVEKEFLYASNEQKRIIPLMYEMSKLPIWLLNMHYVDIQGGNYKKNFSHILAAVEDEPLPVPPPSAKGWFGLSPRWIGGIAGGVVLLFAAVFGLRALLGNRDAGIEGTATNLPIASFSTFTPAPIIETSTPETNVQATPSPMPSPEPATEVSATLTPAPAWIDPKGIEMLLVPAGIFYMGTNDKASPETPIRLITLDAFYIDKYEVTIAQYKKCVEAGQCDLPTNQRAYFDTNLRDHPVTYVNWEMAKAYCEWRGARLPTDAEWEKAARDPREPLDYPWGNKFDGKFLNYCDARCSIPEAKDKNYIDGFENTAPVDSFEDGRSPYGLYNMVGNVEEWVADWYDSSYYANLPRQNPPGPETGTLRVLRGGSWVSNQFSVRVFERNRAEPEATKSYIGFRCAADITR